MRYRMMFLALNLLFLTSCSTLDLAKGALGMGSDIPNVNVKAQAGKSNVVNEGLVNSDTGDRIDADEIGVIDKSDKRTGDNNDNSTTNIPWWTAVLLLFVRPLVIIKESMDLFIRPTKTTGE